MGEKYDVNISKVTGIVVLFCVYLIVHFLFKFLFRNERLLPGFNNKFAVSREDGLLAWGPLLLSFLLSMGLALIRS